ncbi:MAG: 3-phosphoglycerate dehydrogenase [Bacteroidales bacterium]|nr:3-phosphoglycerate dehydrogenase [Bacteroidales bacterium]
MKKVLVATVKPFAPAAVKQIKTIIEDAGYEFVLLEKYADQSDFINAVADVDALIIRSDKATAEVINAAKNLKIIIRAGAGYDNIDLAAATEKNVVAMNTPGQNSNAVAELAMGMMVYLARNQFNGSAGKELRGKNLGMHAYGHVGKLVGEIAKGFGMKLYAYDPYISKEIIENDGVEYVDDIKDLYSKCDYVSLHIPANDETKGSINYDLISLMPENATLVNTARKEVINETDLIKAFENIEGFKYISDIAPDCNAEVSEKFPGRFFFTPKKSGAQTSEANINAGVAAANQIRDFFEKGDTKFQVNK